MIASKQTHVERLSPNLGLMSNLKPHTYVSTGRVRISEYRNSSQVEERSSLGTQARLVRLSRMSRNQRPIVHWKWLHKILRERGLSLSTWRDSNPRPPA